MAQVIQHPAIAALNKKGDKKKEDLAIDDSSFLMSASHDGKSQLTITMKNGSQYVYSNVDPSLMEEFKQSQNKGKFYADRIKALSGGSTRTINKTIGKSVKK